MRRFIGHKALFVMLISMLFSVSACKKGEPQFEYEVVPLEGTVWEGTVYSFPEENEVISRVRISFNEDSYGNFYDGEDKITYRFEYELGVKQIGLDFISDTPIYEGLLFFRVRTKSYMELVFRPESEYARILKLKRMI